jgi:helicase
MIAAPTSSGKTTIAEMAAVDGALRGQKTVYLVTHKALAEEKYQSFKSTYETETDKWFEVSIATGDRTEGDWNDGILVATYEKYLALISSSNVYSVNGKVVVADEIQILSDSSRGPDIEILCSIIIEQKPAQFIALSATAPNVNEISGWMNCEFINVNYRDVPLRQEVWIDGRCYYNYLGDDEIYEDDDTEMVTDNTLQAVHNLLDSDYGPILVFTMTKRDATELAERFSQFRQQDTKSYRIAEQLELWSEPTALSEVLKGTTERKVAFHSADLSFAERSVVEKALRDRNLDVVFSTPTLAAGVNFPIRTVIFNSFSRFWIAGDPWIPKSEYLNMSGRAGRLGLDDEGLSVLIPSNRTEYIKAQEYLSPDVAPLKSRLFNKSIRKSVLHLISSRVCKSEEEINHFYSGTFWWHQTLESNPARLNQVEPLVSESLDWLFENELLAGTKKHLYSTPLGKSISSTGLLPSTGVFLLSLLIENESSFLNDEYELPLIHAICSSDDFSQDHGQRFLPFARRNQPEQVAWVNIKSAQLFIDPVQVENYDRVTNASYGIYQWAKGVPERELRRTIPAISYGQFHTLSSDIAWILEGLSKIASTPGLNFQISLATRLRILAERVRFGVIEEALDVLKVAKTQEVPGLGRQRAMALVNQGIFEPNKIVNSEPKDLKKAVENIDRARLLIEAVGKYFSMNFAYWKNRHLQKAESLKVDIELINSVYDSLGSEYEDVIKSMLDEFGWKVSKLDAHKRQGVPDLLLSNRGISVLLECKTKKSNEATINKENAFAVLNKGVDINADHSATIGKPDFDTFSKSKAGGSKRITLVPHFAFIEAFLLWKEGKISSEQIFDWIITPGVASIELLKRE